MARNRELIRQWTLLQRLASRRGNTIPTLAADLGVTTRTVRRDLTALQAAGFPVYDVAVNGTKFWRLDAKALIAALARNALTVPEICALYSGRALLGGVAGGQTVDDLQSALGKIGAALPPGMKRFLDRLPTVIAAKRAHGKRQRPVAPGLTTRLVEAAAGNRVIRMRYHSNDSGREKDYLVHPYRLVHAQNALYLQAYVPAYGEFRTFLLDRIKRLTVEEDTFDRIAELGSDPFSKSMGIHSGPTVKVKLRFAPQVASVIRDRIWHDSQQLKDRPDGSVVMTLQVCDDYALRQWILGFGKRVRVLAPATLVEWVLDQLDEAREQYESGAVAAGLDSDVQPALPFLFGQLART